VREANVFRGRRAEATPQASCIRAVTVAVARSVARTHAVVVARSSSQTHAAVVAAHASMPLPEPTGPHRVGVIEADVAAPTEAGVVPCVIYYPAGASTAEPSYFSSEPTLQWLDARYAGALGRCHLAETLGPYTAEVFMNALGPSATGYERVRGAVGAPALPAPAGGWPTAVFSHSMTGWRHVNSAFMSEIASRGAVAIHVEHCDGSACLATAVGDGRVLAEYVSWQDKEAELRAAHGDEKDAWAAALAWRHGQCATRVAETLAALDGVDGALLAAGVLPADVDITRGRFSRTSSGVAALGQSFGGASAAACVARDDRGRFSHCLLYDPWLDGDGSDRHPLPDGDYAAAPLAALANLSIWRNGQSQLLATCSKNCDALVARAGAAGRVHDYADAGHFAQTDAPVVFEQGPLSFVYDALRGKDGAMDSATALRRCTEESVAALASFFSAESG
jgi:hypothetical protein